jgi:hypothetical protein
MDTTYRDPLQVFEARITAIEEQLASQQAEHECAERQQMRDAVSGFYGRHPLDFANARPDDLRRWNNDVDSAVNRGRARDLRRAIAETKPDNDDEELPEAA